MPSTVDYLESASAGDRAAYAFHYVTTICYMVTACAAAFLLLLRGDIIAKKRVDKYLIAYDKRQRRRPDATTGGGVRRSFQEATLRTTIQSGAPERLLLGALPTSHANHSEDNGAQTSSIVTDRPASVSIEESNGAFGYGGPTQVYMEKDCASSLLTIENEKEEKLRSEATTCTVANVSQDIHAEEEDTKKTQNHNNQVDAPPPPLAIGLPTDGRAAVIFHKKSVSGTPSCSSSRAVSPTRRPGALNFAQTQGYSSCAVVPTPPSSPLQGTSKGRNVEQRDKSEYSSNSSSSSDSDADTMSDVRVLPRASMSCTKEIFRASVNRSANDPLLVKSKSAAARLLDGPFRTPAIKDTFRLSPYLFLKDHICRFFFFITIFAALRAALNLAGTLFENKQLYTISDAHIGDSEIFFSLPNFLFYMLPLVLLHTYASILDDASAGSTRVPATRRLLRERLQSFDGPNSSKRLSRRALTLHIVSGHQPARRLIRVAMVVGSISYWTTVFVAAVSDDGDAIDAADNKLQWWGSMASIIIVLLNIFALIYFPQRLDGLVGANQTPQTQLVKVRMRNTSIVMCVAFTVRFIFVLPAMHQQMVNHMSTQWYYSLYMPLDLIPSAVLMIFLKKSSY